jgi:hypothetical protein
LVWAMRVTRDTCRCMHARSSRLPTASFGSLTRDRDRQLSGSDGLCGGRSWVRFWLWNVGPVVRAGGSSDHLRAAFGRVVAEAVFLAPASLLPENGVTWEAVGSHTARASVTHLGMVQTVNVSVDDEGRPQTVVMPRWSDANADRPFSLGCSLSAARCQNSAASGLYASDAHRRRELHRNARLLPFYKARIERLRFLPAT